MNNPQHDIALIRKYHNGELSPAEKNKLEARALDDPFLQDALDGYEVSSVKDDDLAFLTQRLNDRIEPDKVTTAVWGFKQWGIAASVIFCIALASIYFNQTPRDKTIALNDVQQKEDIPQAEKPVITQDETIQTDAPTLDENPEIPREIAESPNLLNKNESFAPDADIVVQPLASSSIEKSSSSDLEEVTVVGYPTQKKQDITGAVASIKAENLMTARMLRSDKAMQMVKVKGRIIDEKDSTGLPGVSIKNLATGVTKQTNANGEFTIETNPNSDLAISYLGYETMNKTFQETSDSVLIVLAPVQNSLSEVNVVGYGTKKIKTDRIVGPKVGWQRFKNYVQDQAENANIGRGKVQLQFIINANGNPSDFKVVESFSAKAGVAAINIIKNYNGGWWGSIEKIPHKTSITIKFK